MIAADLTNSEAQILVNWLSDIGEWRAESKEGFHALNDAARFHDAWLFHKGASVESMIWALNNEALPFRAGVIAQLVAMRLHESCK